jgi:arginyl-tRNA--protein-N-Asp/Glu arginylyltransferase
MANTTKENYINFLSSHWCNTLFVEFSCNNELAGIAIVDLLDNALSAVYTFFDPKYSARSLGVYAVLWQIEHACIPVAKTRFVEKSNAKVRGSLNVMDVAPFLF